jgi:hypothetical protein
MRNVIHRVLIALAIAQLLLAIALSIRIGSAIRWGIIKVSEIPEPTTHVHMALPESLGRRSRLTPGFVEGFIQAKSGESIRISTSYSRQEHNWRLSAECAAGHLIVERMDLTDACAEFLKVYYEKTKEE